MPRTDKDHPLIDRESITAKEEEVPNGAMTALKYLNDLGCQLFVSGKSIQEISNSVGFEDPFYFSRAFKEIKGVSPRQYANNLRREAEESR